MDDGRIPHPPLTMHHIAMTATKNDASTITEKTRDSVPLTYKRTNDKVTFPVSIKNEY